MRNLLIFLAKYHAVFLFLCLAIICFYLIGENKNYQRAFFINSSNIVSGNILKINSDVSHYLALKEINDSLLAENARLRSEQLLSSFQLDTVNTYYVEDSLLQQWYTFIPATVTNNSINKFNNYLTLNRGRRHGIEPGMGVIHANGVVGKVVTVSENFSSVMSVLHNDIRIGAKIGEKGSRGIVAWNGRNPFMANLEYVTIPANMTLGDSIFTTGASTVFPPGVLIGTVDDFSIRPGSSFYDIDIKLATPFNRLHYVYVINSIFSQEKSELENTRRFD